MAEEHGKGIALVILGIVAIIAIVGLVLLFTGARKTATGDFTAPSVKTYGGAINSEEQDPYGRRTLAGAAGQLYGSSGVQAGGQCYGDACKERVVTSSDYTTFNRALPQIPAKASCTFMAEQSGLPQLSEPASSNEAQVYAAQGRQCVAVDDLASVADQTGSGYGRVPDALDYAKSIGVAYCCEAPGLSGTV